MTNNSPDVLSARLDAMQLLMTVFITATDHRMRDLLRDELDRAMLGWHAIGLQTKLSDEYLESFEQERQHWQARFQDADRDAQAQRAK